MWNIKQDDIGNNVKICVFIKQTLKKTQATKAATTNDSTGQIMLSSRYCPLACYKLPYVFLIV